MIETCSVYFPYPFGHYINVCNNNGCSYITIRHYYRESQMIYVIYKVK